MVGLVGCKTAETVTVAQFNTLSESVASLSKDVASLNNSLSKLETVATSSLSSSTSTASKISSFENKIAVLEASANSVKSNMSDLETQVATFVASQPKTADANKTIVDLQTAVKTLTDTLTVVKADLDTVKKQLATLVPSPVTTAGQVIGSIVPNVFTGATSLSIASIPAGGSSSQQFTIQIDNQTGAELKSIGLALALQVFDANGNNYSVPATMTFSMLSGNPALTWIQQSTGVGYVLGYINNTASTGFLALFGGLVVKTGVNTYTQTLTINNTSAVASTPITIVLPIIKVTAFSIK
jgi:prefoldin subunit 5